MPEYAVTIIFFALCLGQVWALARGRLTAVIYFVCAASLPHFSCWFFVSWDTVRVCGAMLALGGALLYRRPPGIPRAGSRGLWILFAYIVILTLVNSLFWPIEAINARSAAYGFLRGYIQIFNWAVSLGAAWQIALALYEKGAFDRVRRWIIILGTFHGIVALYQVSAFWTGLPITGIRRVGTGFGLDASNPHLAICNFGGLSVYRATSFAGEPRSLAALCVLWIAVLFTLYAQGRADRRTHLALLLALLVIVLTFSTSGWGGLFCCLALMACLTRRQRKSQLVLGLVFSAAAGITLAVEFAGVLPEQISVATVFEQRFTKRMEDPLSDLPVKETIHILSTNPQFVLLGAGAGGMSFYIAESLGGNLQVILTSTVGCVAFLGDIGLLGLFLMIAVMWGGIRNVLSFRPRCNDIYPYLSFVGCVCLCQTLITAPAWILPVAFGFLLASQFRSEAIRRTRIVTRTLPSQQ